MGSATATCTPGTDASSIVVEWTDSAVTATATVDTDSCDDDLKVKASIKCPSGMGKYKIQFDNIWDQSTDGCVVGTTTETFDLTDEVEKAAGTEMSSTVAGVISAGLAAGCEIEIDFGDEECTYTSATASALNAAGISISYAKENPAGTTGFLFAVAALAGLAVYAVKRRNRAKKSLINDDMLAGKDGQVV